MSLTIITIGHGRRKLLHLPSFYFVKQLLSIKRFCPTAKFFAKLPSKERKPEQRKCTKPLFFRLADMVDSLSLFSSARGIGKPVSLVRHLSSARTSLAASPELRNRAEKEKENNRFFL